MRVFFLLPKKTKENYSKSRGEASKREHTIKLEKVKFYYTRLTVTKKTKNYMKNKEKKKHVF